MQLFLNDTLGNAFIIQYMMTIEAVLENYWSTSVCVLRTVLTEIPSKRITSTWL